MKRHVVKILMMVALLCCGAAAKAQDGAIVAAAVEIQTLQDERHQATNWAQKIKEWLETNSYRATTLENFSNQLLTSKSTLETIKSGFRIATKFWQDAGILLEIYDAVEVVIDDVNRVKRQIEFFKKYKVYSDGMGINIVQPVSSTVKLVDRLAGDVYDILGFVKTQVFAEQNSLTWGERMELANEALHKINTDHSILNSISNDLDAQIRLMQGNLNLDEQQQLAQDLGVTRVIAQNVSNDLIGNGVDPKIWEELSASFASRGELNMPSRQQIKNASNYRAPQKQEDNTTISEEEVNRSGVAIINMVFLAISLLAAVFLGWNFWQLSHGDKQHMDALWKVGAGYIIMAVFLQVFKMVFFS